MNIKPNHKCMNSECGKEYYACNYCDKTSYRKYACSPECYAKVVDYFAAQKKKLIRNTPTDEELSTAYTESVAEISEAVPNVEKIGIEAAVEIINKKIETGATKKPRKKKAGGE